MVAKFPDFLDADAKTVAQKLLGCYLVRRLGDQEIVVKIVETESYDQSDPASHSFNGETNRTSIMFGPSGFLYVYFTYGMHYCCNVVCGPKNQASAVLIRAVEPIKNLELIKANRDHKNSNLRTLTNGPAKLCQALKINKELNGHDLRKIPLRLETGEPLKSSQTTATTRIGISKSQKNLERFYINNNAFVSKL